MNKTWYKEEKIESHQKSYCKKMKEMQLKKACWKGMLNEGCDETGGIDRGGGPPRTKSKTTRGQGFKADTATSTKVH